MSTTTKTMVSRLPNHKNSGGVGAETAMLWMNITSDQRLLDLVFSPASATNRIESLSTAMWLRHECPDPKSVVSRLLVTIERACTNNKN